MEELAGRGEKATRQIRQRLAGEKITDRIVSLADPDARPIRQGKIGRPTELGYVSQLAEVTEHTKPGARRLILPASHQIGNPSENTLLPCSCKNAAPGTSRTGKEGAVIAKLTVGLEERRMQKSAIGGLAALAFVFVFALAAAAAPAGAKGAVWLCFPGKSPDPCRPGLSTTRYSPTLTPLGVEHPKAVKHPAIDCFYVYPTVSGQMTGNANLHIDSGERSIALYQAARYSQECRVFAPMYRQVTLNGFGLGLGKPTTTPHPSIALADVRSAFHSYLTKYNHGRGFVLIGHSQGSTVLRELIAKDVDPKPSVRRRVVSAILFGGNVLVKRGSNVGGDFKRIPGCRRATQIGCVIAFSTFDQPVPPDSNFGRPSFVLATTQLSHDVVLCTNPASLGGGSGLVHPIFPSAPFDPESPFWAGIAQLGINAPTPSTVWWSTPGSYVASCSSADNAHVLEIKSVGGAVDPTPDPSATWGLHLMDANIALGNLISIVSKEAAAYVVSGR